MDSLKPLAVLDSWSSISDKTVFVLDRSTYFTQISSGHSIDGDCLKDLKKTAHLYTDQPAIHPFDRSLWTCTIEAVVGYSRLVWDLFTPDQRCISILSASTMNTEAKSSGTLEKAEPTFFERICTWQDEDQNLDQLMRSLAKSSCNHRLQPSIKLEQVIDIAAYPNCNSESISIINSLDQALSELGHLTNAQIKKKISSKTTNSSASNSLNNGRIILISSFQSEESIHNLIDKLERMLVKKNASLKEALCQSSDSMSQINYCDLVIVNTFPISDVGPCSKICGSNSIFRPYLHSKVYSVKSGRTIAGLLNNLCLQHHNLRSTTITGIPMKEEQNASSSSQYDVEIVHCSSIHEDILRSGSPLLEGVVEVMDRNGFPCDTFKLSWCTPRSSAIELNHCVATSRITAVDVNSRPSACLTNFLLNGRQVMLEIFKSKSNRVTTHILASHNGELYIHSLANLQPKSNIGDPPSICDYLGGKVGDYRLNEFVQFMKLHTLCRSQKSDDALSRTCNILKRQTLYWPLTLGHTILLNIPHLTGQLVQLIPKESLNQSDFDECKKSLDNLAKLQSEGQALPSVSITEIINNNITKSGGTKLDQLYRLLWNELEYYLRVHSTTPEHEAILEYLLDKNGDKILDVTSGCKRTAPRKSITNSLKRIKPTSQLIPEIGDLNASVQQTAMYYKSGMSLWQTWTQIYFKFHQNKNKLSFVGRTKD